MLLALFTGCQHRLQSDMESVVVELTDASFRREVLESDRPVLVEFWARWCQPCQDMRPTLEQLAHKVRGEAKVATLNIDDYPDTAALYNADSPPVVIIFRDGKIVRRRSGKQSKQALRELVFTVGT